MKYFFFFCALFLIVPLALSKEAPEKDFLKNQLSGSFGYNTLTLPFGTFSDPGTTFSVGRFLLPKLSINGHYFLTLSPTGASNVNGFGFGGKYYFYNTETSFELEKGKSRIRNFDKYFAYGSFQFLDREVRTSRVNISFTGFALSVGGGYKLNFHNSIAVDFQTANLKSALGSTTGQDATLMNLSINYSYLF